MEGKTDEVLCGGECKYAHGQCAHASERPFDTRRPRPLRANGQPNIASRDGKLPRKVPAASLKRDASASKKLAP